MSERLEHIERAWYIGAQLNGNNIDWLIQQAKDCEYWYDQTQQLNQSLIRQDKVIDDYMKQLKEYKKQSHDQIAKTHEWIKHWSEKKDEVEKLKKLIQEIDYIVGDWEWHYCPEGTPQKAIYNLILRHMKNK